MPVYDRGHATDYAVVDEFDGGVGWLAHPDEEGKRTSHAIRGDDGRVWLFDPIDAEGIEDVYADLGEVAGVAVCSSWHARDAATFARRHDVPVYAPTWLGRVGDLLDAPIERYEGELGTSGFAVRRVDPLPGWQEAVCFRASDRTLYVPDVLSTAMKSCVGDERIGLFLFARFFPPRAAFADWHPDRILVGHGTGVFEDADAALQDALAGARRRLPRGLLTRGPAQVRAMLGAVRD
ncbi:hypothetical protein [Haloarchaeobius amylolyticus]|uniref:hypothetical protein n=1 Tax=Haloarchaeobius amylolyticus TaxID=1198296 RepID=UPI002271B888|nr:hypothetical protein [Haloarchaeobius amylolyticus]